MLCRQVATDVDRRKGEEGGGRGRGASGGLGSGEVEGRLLLKFQSDRRAMKISHPLQLCLRGRCCVAPHGNAWQCPPSPLQVLLLLLAAAA